MHPRTCLLASYSCSIHILVVTSSSRQDHKELRCQMTRIVLSLSGFQDAFGGRKLHQLSR
ncbi:hypothetical protein PPTG_24632 [Phytophthora nicotianae INRA-310]|uniref:Uncharacterized protein n=1 Tax=Phytophthora nicotianae (strain INRA-310) TaxID=761204 RepID=W2PDV3_PHYN3|nr:hypothetical protein PPTG_24632 [Phytophthora nicotianae INRA-310]ETM98378.1 hypothetical protein PPTG_24632 [Phytophthora nicotianae INRA-310]